MKRGVPLIVVLVAIAAYAGERNYRAGVLKKIDIKDVTSTLPIPTESGPNISLPLPLGINYQFQIQSDMIVYVGNCWSKDKKNYGSEWVVNDPIEFRVDKDKLLLKRPNKGEFLRSGTKPPPLCSTFFAPLSLLVPKPPKNYDFRSNGAAHGRYSRLQ